MSQLLGQLSTWHQCCVNYNGNQSVNELQINLEHVARKYHVMATLPNIGGALYWMLLIKSRKSPSCNLRTKKRRAVLSNCKPTYTKPGMQLWLERDVVKHICFSFSICSLVFKLHEFKVAPSPNYGAKISRFSPLKMYDLYHNSTHGVALVRI